MAVGNNYGVVLAGNCILGGPDPGDGNVISGNAVGIRLFRDNNKVQGNLIGTDLTGTRPLGNAAWGILAQDGGNNNLIGDLDTNAPGTPLAGGGNVISGNGDGVLIQGTPAASGDTIEGNYIGTDITGTTTTGTDGKPLGNSTGVELGNGATNNTIGGTTPAARNIISGNGSAGIAIGDDSGATGVNLPSNNVVEGNYIGTDVTGAVALGNGAGWGIALGGTLNNTIGGTAPGAGNVIAGMGVGVVFYSNNYPNDPNSSNVVQGNYIGTDATGVRALGAVIGVQFSDIYDTNNLIGGTTPGAGNVIAASRGFGIQLNEGENNAVEGNWIGTNPGGATGLGNAGGVALSAGASGNTIGGTAAGAGNTIADNGGDGVLINGSFTNSNAILGNSIHDNAGLGIQLTGGANNNQAAPVLTAAASSSGSTYVGGDLTSVPSTTFRIEFFANTSPDPSGFGQGERYLGFEDVTTDSRGDAAFIATLSGVDPSRPYVSATATRLDGVTSAPADTSAFSNDVNDLALPSAYRVTTTADSGPGSLRDAINQANVDTNHLLYPSPSNPNVDEIDFAITAASDVAGGGTGYDSGTGVCTITPLTPLPDITAPMTIDGYSQPGAQINTLASGENAVLKIVLNGSQAVSDGTQQDTFGVCGLNLRGGSTTIRGLVINNFSASGMFITSNDNIVEGDYIGTGVTGEHAQGNGDRGLEIGLPSIPGFSNRIGTYGNGTNDFADRNVLSANVSAGVEVNWGSSYNVVAGNYIGTDASGTRPLGNGLWGVVVYGGPIASGHNQVGGYGPADLVDGNLISANAYDGIAIGGDEADNSVYGNYIGTDVTGTKNLGNRHNGVLAVTGTQGVVIGGNVIAYNGEFGVAVSQDTSGIYAPAPDAIPPSSGPTDGVQIEGNSIHDNGTLGIDLGGTYDWSIFQLDSPLPGVLLNDSQGHAGPNHFQDFPVLTSATSSSTSTVVSGTFSEASEPSTTLTLDFYANPAADPSGYGQGQTWLRSTKVTTDANGNASFTASLPALPAGQNYVTATATDASGNTSEFGKDITIPIASAGGPYALSEGNNLTLNASASSDPAGGPLTYTWDVNGDGVFGDATGVSPMLTWSQLEALGISDGPATFNVQVMVTNSQGNSAFSPATTLTVNDTPVSSLQVALQSSSINEGSYASLSGSFVNPSPVDANTVVISWGDGSPNTTLNLAPGVVTFAGLTHQYLDQPDGSPSGSYMISVTVSDNEGGQASAATAVQVNAVLPTATVSGPALGVPGQPRTFTFSAVSPSPTDQAAGFSYAVNWGDGKTQTIAATAGNGAGVVVDHIYTAPGAYSVTVTATDDDGRSPAASQTISVQTVQMEGNSLAVGGTLGNATVTLTPADTAGDVNVNLNGVSRGNFKPTDHILVYSQSGNDTIRLASARIAGTTYYITVPAFLYGGGNSTNHDVLDARGSTANNVIVGGAGKNMIFGGLGRDLLIAGLGATTLHAGSADDILIGGWTGYADLTSSAMTYAQKLTALDAIMAEWGSSDSYATRVTDLNNGGGLNGAYILNASAVHDNGQADTLFGAPTSSSALDWFFAGLSDVVKNNKPGEVTTSIS
jgi:hypothetical protein